MAINFDYNIDKITLNGIDATGTVEAATLVKTGGTSSQFLKADGTVDSNTYLTSEVNDLTINVTWDIVPDAYISQSSVTQHESALTITQSQISDLNVLELDALSVVTNSPSGIGSLAYSNITGTFTYTPPFPTLDSVTTNGNSTTNTVLVGSLGVGNGITTPAESIEVAGNVEAVEFIGQLRGPVLFKAQAGEALVKGDVVYISGISGQTTIVSKADADDASKMPAFGLVSSDSNINTACEVITFGTLSGISTNTYTEGDELYVSTTPGVLQNTAPTGESSLIQKIAKVTRSAQASGSLKVMGAGRTNAVPNLNDGNIFIGNNLNQPVTITLDTSIVPENNSLYFTTARVDDHLNTSTATTNDYLKWSGTDYEWDTVPPGYTDSDVDAHLNTSTATANTILQWNGNDYSWGAITESQISDLQTYYLASNPNNYISTYTVTESDVTQHQAALSITESQISDFQSYQLLSQKGSANGYASLDTGGKVPTTQLPALALTEVSVVADQAARLALTAQEGDVAIQTDISTTFIHNGGTAGTTADWEVIEAPVTEVDPVFTASTAFNISDGTGFLKNNGSGVWSYDSNTYLTSFTETDPVFSAATVSNISDGTGFLKNNGSGVWSYDNNTYPAIQYPPNPATDYRINIWCGPTTPASGYDYTFTTLEDTVDWLNENANTVGIGYNSNLGSYSPARIVVTLEDEATFTASGDYVRLAHVQNQVEFDFQQGTASPESYTTFDENLYFSIFNCSHVRIKGNAVIYNLDVSANSNVYLFTGELHGRSLYIKDSSAVKNAGGNLRYNSITIENCSSLYSPNRAVFIGYELAQVTTSASSRKLHLLDNSYAHIRQLRFDGTSNQYTIDFSIFDKSYVYVALTLEFNNNDVTPFGNSLINLYSSSKLYFDQLSSNIVIGNTLAANNFLWGATNYSSNTTNIMLSDGSGFFTRETSRNIVGRGFTKVGGLSTEFLKADGSVDSNTYLTASDPTLSSVTTNGNTTTNAITVGTFTSTGIDDNATSTALTIDSGQDVTFTSDAKFPNNGMARFGASENFKIYDDGTNSRIQSSNASQLLIQGNDIWLTDITTGEDYLRAIGNGAVYIYYNGIKKFETTNTGIDVTGTVTATGATLTSLSNQASEATALMINGSNVVGTRELGSNAFNSTAYLPLTGGTVTGAITAPTFVASSTTYTTTTDFAVQDNGVIRSGSGLWVAGNGLNFGTTTTNSPTSGYDANVTTRMTISNTGNISTAADGQTLTVLATAGDVVLGGSGTIAGATWANGAFHLGSATSGWAMDPNELYNSGAAIIGTLDSSLTLNPATSTTTSRPFVSTNDIEATSFTVTSGTSSQFLKANGTVDSSTYLTGNQTITLSGDVTGSGTTSIVCTVANDSHTHDTRYYTETESDTRFTSIDHFRAISTRAYTSTTTAALFETEMLADDYFDSYLAAGKASWSYAGNGDLTDAGNLTELAGCSFLTWTDNSADNTLGNYTALVIAPNTGGSAYRTMIYNDQGDIYSPGWREILTDKTYNDFVPSLTGTGASGTWGISISGNAATATSATTATQASGAVPVQSTGVDDRDKIRVWSGGTYGFGMESAVTFGYLNDYAITTQMSNTDARGFWWGDTGHAKSGGAMSLTSTGQLYVATRIAVGEGETDTSPLATYTLNVTGTIGATSNITAYASDKRLKENIKPIENALSKVQRLRGVTFDWKDSCEDIGFTPEFKTETGVIAQEVQEIIPDAVKTAPFNERAIKLTGADENYLTVDKEKIVPLLIEAIKEQQAQIDELKEIIRGSSN